MYLKNVLYAVWQTASANTKDTHTYLILTKVSQRIWGENKNANPSCSAELIIPDGEGNYLLISLVKIISWNFVKIIYSHNVLRALNRHLI